MAGCGSARGCRSSKSVENSANSVGDNTAAGGHVWTHIFGLNSKPKRAQKRETQKDKTLFVSEAGFSSAWKKFQSRNFSYLTPKECKGSQNGQMVDCVLASDIGVKKSLRMFRS